MLEINITDETSQLRSVIIGTAESLGGTPNPEDAYDPKSREHILNGTYPEEKNLQIEIEGFAKILQDHDVEILRPEIVEDYNQIFTRDIGFVIDDFFIKPNILEKRKREIEGIRYIHSQLPKEQLLVPPQDARIEGGDVMPWNDYIFIGYSNEEDFNKYVVSRTNEAGVNFIKNQFPYRMVKAFELSKSDEDPRENALHLDCCFQPIGYDQAIIYKGGFKHQEDVDFLVEYFGHDKILEVNKEEMYQMCSNIFSINPEVIVSAKSFERLNHELEKRGFKVEKVDYDEVAKMEGLLRCSTLPLLRV